MLILLQNLLEFTSINLKAVIRILQIVKLSKETLRNDKHLLIKRQQLGDYIVDNHSNLHSYIYQLFLGGWCLGAR